MKLNFYVGFNIYFILLDNHWSLNDGSKLIKCVLKLLEVNIVAVPLLQHVELMRNACLPINLGGYWIIDEQCGGQLGTELKAAWSIQELWTKSIICCVSYFNWCFLVSGSFTQITLVILVKSYCMKNYILLAGRKIHENNVGTYWKTCLMLREIGIYSSEYRRLFSCYMTCCVILFVMLEHILSLYACLHFGNELPLPMIISFGLGVLNAGIVVIFFYSNLAKVFTTSKYALEIKLKCGKSEMSPWFQRFLKSSRIVKISIGDTNFVEPLTPLTVEQFCIEQVISLILVENR